VLFALVYIAGVITLARHDDPLAVMQEPPAHHATVAIFGASGTAGDGILKAAMWAREKVRAEKTLFGFADGTTLRVIAYRPDYIGPTKEEAHVGQNLLYWFFRPVGAAVRATQIGQAMIEVTARGPQFENGDYLGTWNIGRYSDAYEERQ